MQRPRINLDALLRQSRTASAGPSPSHLTELTGFGTNPAGIRAFISIPEGLPAGAPLVVALHGCTQTAAGYDHGAGWSTLARAHGFAVLLPEQTQANNANRCWNWFDSAHTTRGRGEVASINQAILHVVAAHGLDPARIFVTGLSAGGAMTATMLATYPERFAAGAILAGLPHGAAGSVQEAFQAMSTGSPRSARAWGDLVRSASPHRGPWPRVAIWQGDADRTVQPVNAEQLVRQWTDVHGLTAVPRSEELLPGYRRARWRGADGRTLVETHAIRDLAHGVPLDPGDGAGRVGVAGPHMLDVGISSSHAIAAFFGLAPEPVLRVPRPAEHAGADSAGASWAKVPDWVQNKDAHSGPGAVIRKALTAAGLLRP